MLLQRLTSIGSRLSLLLGAWICALSLTQTAHASTELPQHVFSSQSFKEGTSLELRDWLAKPGEYVEPTAALELDGHWLHTELPLIPRNLSQTSVIPEIATYMTQVLLPKTSDPLVLKVPRLYAATVFITDGEEVLFTVEHGHPTKSYETTRAVYREEFIPIPNHIENLVIIIHQATFHHSNGGMWDIPTIGSATSQYTTRLRDRIKSATLVGLLLVIGIYHIVIFLLRQSDLTPLFFGIVAVAAAIREFVMGRLGGELGWIDNSIPLTRLEYVTMPISMICLERYLSHLLDRPTLSFVRRIVVILGIILIAATPIVSSYQLTAGLPFFQFHIVMTLSLSAYTVSLEAKSGNTHAQWIAIAFTALTAAVVNDILLAQGVINSSYLTQYIFTGFVLLQAILISQKSAKAFKERDENQRKLLLAYQELDDELLNRENLIKVNQGLEEEIKFAGEELIQAGKLATLGTVVAGVAHDIASPSNLIIYANEVLEENRKATTELLIQIFEQDDSQEAQDVLNIFKEKFSHMEKAESDIELGISRINSIQSAIRNQSRHDQEKISFSLRELVEECLVILNTKLKSVKVLNNIPEETLFVGRRSQIGQVYTNLISNAADAVLEKRDEDRSFEPIILLTTHTTTAGETHFSIDDNGNGVPEEFREKVKEAFFTTKDVGKGTGLGMSIILKILKEHGYDLDIGVSAELGGARMQTLASKVQS